MDPVRLRDSLSSWNTTMQRFGDEKPDAEFEAMLDLMGLLYGDAVLLRSPGRG